MLAPRGESKHRLPKLTRILLSLVLSNDFIFLCFRILIYILRIRMSYSIIGVLHIGMIY